MDTTELLLTAGRAFAVYALLLLVIRLLGKREVGNFTAFDLLVALMLGEVVDEIIYGDVEFAQGAVAIGAIALIQFGTSWLSYANHTADKLLDGVPTIMVRDGELQHEGMRKERVNQQELMGLLREQEIEDLREIKLAVLEVGGELSVIKHRWAEPLQKADFGGSERDAREKALGGQQDPPEPFDTCSPKALS
jgi:uncharacterized membrane protein YcaP (DUF421 family)